MDIAKTKLTLPGIWSLLEIQGTAQIRGQCMNPAGSAGCLVLPNRNWRRGVSPPPAVNSSNNITFKALVGGKLAGFALR